MTIRRMLRGLQWSGNAGRVDLLHNMRAVILAFIFVAMAGTVYRGQQFSFR